MTSTVYFPETPKYPSPRQWNLDTIWELSNNLPKRKIKVSELWNNRYKKAWCWQHEGEELNNQFFLHHMERVLKADLSYPIILSEEKLIFDGVHRLVKARHLGLEYIECRRFTKDPPSNDMLLRKNIDKTDITEINSEIAAYQNMINYYEQYLETDRYEYVQERLNKLYSKQAEYLIARESALN